MRALLPLFAAASLLTGALAWADEPPAEPGVIAAHGVSAFGVLKYPPDFTHFDYVNPDAPKGGVFSSQGTGASRTFDSLNPYILKGEPAQGMTAGQSGNLVFDTLMARAWDEPDAVYGLVAYRIEYPEDRSWAEFFLRPEARFADGSPVTSADVVFSLNTIKEKGAPRFKILFEDVVSAEAIDSQRVRFTFAAGKPTRDLPMLVGSTLPILSAAYYQERDFAESSLEPPLTSGPYRVGAVEPGRRIVYERRDDYWGWDVPVNRGRFNFGEVVYEYFKDSTAAFEAFKSGAFVLHEEFLSKLWATAYDFPAVKQGWVKLDELPDGRPSGMQGYWLNMRRPALADIRVREALALGFDFEWSNKALFYDLYDRTDSFFEGSDLQAEGPPSPEELALLQPLADQLPADALGPAYVPPTTDGSGRNRENLRAASTLLDEAGWAVGTDGMRRNAEGALLSIEFLDDSPAFERITGPFVQNLRKIGVDASTRTIDPAQYQARIETFDFDATVARFSLSLTPDTELRAFFSSRSADQPSSFNLSGVANPAIDALVEDVIAAKNREELTTAAHALDRALRALHIWVPQWHKNSHTIAYWDMFGRPAIKPPYDRGIIETWWIDEARAAALNKARGL